jgi:glycosyltransferase involved in cell wall biosynthesis
MILVLNRNDKDYLKKKGVNPEKVKVISGGVDYSYVARIRPLENKQYDGCFVGRFHDQKGLPDLIEIWDEVCKVRKDARLAIVGWGPKEMVSFLRKRLESKSLKDRVDLLGFLDGVDKYRVMKASKLFVFPSNYESWGIVACEAMACGLPVVSYDLELFREIFPRGMKRVPLGNVKSFADMILKLLNDVDLYQQVKKDAFKIAARYDWERVVDSIWYDVSTLMKEES